MYLQGKEKKKVRWSAELHAFWLSEKTFKKALTNKKTYDIIKVQKKRGRKSWETRRIKKNQNKLKKYLTTNGDCAIIKVQ